MSNLEEAIYKNYPQLVDVLIALGAVFFLYALLELAYDWFYRKDQRDFKQSLVDFGVYAGHELAGRLATVVVFFAALTWFAKFSIFKIEIGILSWLTCFIASDFIYYWTHRLEHKIRFFWSWHSVHHSSHEFNATTALRLGWLEPFVAWYSLALLVLVGFDVIQVLLTFQILLTYQTWIHSKRIPHLGWFEKVFNTPSSHRVHHASNPIYLDKNFCAVFIIWDRMFGTYQPESERVVYGLTIPIETNNPIKVNFNEPLYLIKGFIKKKGLYSKVKWLFGTLAIKPETKKRNDGLSK